MDILKSLTGDKTMGVLVSGLIGRGFTRDQAEQFLPEAGTIVVTTLQDTGSSTDVSRILESVDIDRLSMKLGIDNSMISNGLKYIIPGLMDQFNVNNAGSMLGRVKNFY